MVLILSLGKKPVWWDCSCSCMEISRYKGLKFHRFSKYEMGGGSISALANPMLFKLVCLILLWAKSESEKRRTPPPPPLKQTNKETAPGHRAADGFNWICRFWENLTSSGKNLIWHFRFNTESGNIGRSVYQHWFEVIAMQVSEFNTVFTFQLVVVVFFFWNNVDIPNVIFTNYMFINTVRKSLQMSLTSLWEHLVGKKKCL